MTARSRSSAPNTPKQALARDQRLAKLMRPAITDTFDLELRRVLRDPDDIRVQDWEDVLSDMWVTAGNEVFTPAFEQYSGRRASRDARQKQELVALIAEIIKDSNSAETIARHIEESAAGIVKTTRRRIGTVLKRIGTGADARRVSRAIRRLYQTDFITKRTTKRLRRDARIALDQVLRATAAYEHGAALLASEVTGREYVQLWRNQGDDRVRESHSSVQPVSLDEMFKVGGSLLRYPRDPSGPAHETYGCRCWTERKRL